MRGLGSLLPLALLAAGCGGGSSMTHPSNDGILWLSWTVKGQPVSDATCKSIDHLVLTMDTPAGAVEIEPIPCLRGLGWEYDGLPEGYNVVVLDAYDAMGVLSLEGVGNVTVDGTKAAAPTPLDLQLLRQ
ncbi:MAG TPA: hypothetical protein VN947_33105 [Polyangia bacterium]|nr:hypothetical protein [Polyangia bacterium]